MNGPTCPNCHLAMHPVPTGAWPGWYVCDGGHAWRLPLPLTLPGLEPPPSPAISDRSRAILDALWPKTAMRTAARRARARRPSRSATERPYWTR